MANIYIPYIYPLIVYNINANNNDKPSTSYPLILRSQPSTSAFIVPNTVEKSESEPSGQQVPLDKSLIGNNSQVEGEQHRGTKEAVIIMSEPDKPITRTQRRKRGLETDATSPAVDEAEPSPKRTPRGRGGKRRRGLREAPKKLPGTSFNICSNCGTVADKIKAKKCKNCQKFFFEHWAKRCRIPPCPNCHFSRKSRGCEVVPQFCERCGHPLKGDAKMDGEQRGSVGEASSVITEGESTSDTSSFQLSEDLHDIDNLSRSEDEDDESMLEDDVEKDSCFASADISKAEQADEQAHKSGLSESYDRTDEACDTSNKSHDISDEAVDASDKSHDISGETSDKLHDIANEEDTNDNRAQDRTDSDMRDESHDHADYAHETSEKSHDHTEPQVDREMKLTKIEPVEKQGSLEVEKKPEVDTTSDSFVDDNPDDQTKAVPSAQTVEDDEPTSMETSGVKVHENASCSDAADSSTASLPDAVNTTSQAEADLQKSKDSVDTTDTGKIISLSDISHPVESDSQAEAAGDSRLEPNVDATSAPLQEVPSKDKCMETLAATSETHSDKSTEVGKPMASTDGDKKQRHQGPLEEQSQDSSTLNASEKEAKLSAVEGSTPREGTPSKDVDEGTKKEVTPIRCSSPTRFDEQVGTDVAEAGSSSSLVLISRQENPAYSEDQERLLPVDSEGTAALSIPANTSGKKSKRVDSPSLTMSKGKSSKKSSTKSAEKKTPKKKSRKKASIETTPDSTTTTAAWGSPLLVADPPRQEVTNGAAQEKIKMEDHVAKSPPTIPSVSLISSSEVGPLQSTSIMMQSESHVAQLLKPLATMTTDSVVAGLLNNLVERFNQKQLEETPPSPLGQGLQPPPRVESNSKQLNQQIKQSQEQCQELINQATLQLLNPNGGATGNGSHLLPSTIQLPQKRAVSETAEAATEVGDLLPTPSKRLKTSTQGCPSVEETSPAGTPVETSPTAVDSRSMVPTSSVAVMEQSSNDESRRVSQEQTAAATRSSVIQSSSKLFPRSASLPPQLVPSSSLARQESDDDGFPLSSTPCLSHTLLPPPLKPTSPTGSAGPTTAIPLPPVLSSSEAIPVVSLPSLVSGPAPPELKPVSDTFTSRPSKLDSSTVMEDMPSSQSSVIMRVGPSGTIRMTGEPASSGSSRVTGSDPLQSSGSRSLSLSTSPAPGSFHRLEIGSPPPISGQSNKIRVSLLKQEPSSEAVVTSTASSGNSSGVQSPSDGSPSPMTAGGSMAIGGKFQNFALAPNLSVIATVETQNKTQVSSSPHPQQVSRLSPANSDSSSDSKPKSDSQELQKTAEDKYQTGSQDSSRQCTPEDIEELSCQKRISSALTSSTSLGSPSPTSMSQAQLQQPQVPPLVSPIPTSLQGPIPNLPIPGRPGAVSVTVIKSSSQTESESLFSNAGVQATNDRSPGPLGSGGSSLPVAVSSGNNIFGTKVSGLSTVASLSSPLAQGILQPPLGGKDPATGGLPSVGVQAAAPASNFRKIAPRKPGQSGLVTIQVCNTIPNSNSITAAKMSSQSIGVGTEPSASQASGVRMSPGILRPRPSAQIGGVLVTPQPSVGVASPHLQPNGQGVLRKPTSLGGGNGADASLFPSSPPSRSVYVTKLYSNVPSTATTQAGPQGYNPPRVRPSLKELSSPAFEEALLSASKQNAKQTPQQEEEEEREKEKPPKKKKGGKGKAKEGGGGGGGKSPGKSKKNKGKSQGDKGENFATDEVVARFMSEEVLDSESDQISETGSHNGNKKKPSPPGGHGGKGEAGESREDDGERNDDEEDKGERGGDGDKPTKKNKNGKTGGKKDSMKLLLYSVKLKDCFLHHMLWQDYRVVLLVPLNASGGLKSESPGGKTKPGGVETTPTPERKRRRKSKIEPLDINEIEAEMDPLVESPATSSNHIHSPCFSVYELRNKLFSESNAVYAYTYKNQIKTLKPPLHWVHVLKRMGGMQENCHTCRLLDVGNVKGMSQHYGNSSTLPSSLENLCKNELPKGRKVIDLSSLDPEDLLEPGQLDEIPQCSFLEKPPSKKKAPSSASSKKKHRKQPIQASPEEPEKDLMDEFLEQSARSLEQGSSSQPQPEQRVGQSHDPEDGDHDDDDDDEEEGRLVIAQETEEEESTASPRLPTATLPQRSPPPLIKHESPSSSSSKNPQKKKFCPDCGTQIARKCKKCPTCGKRFGVFTFGRKLCPGCGRVNLARMTACYECGHSMQFAQKALPKGTLGDDADSDSKSSSHRSDYVFGSRKRRRVPPLPYSSEYDGFSADASKAPKLCGSAPGESGSRLPSVGDADDLPEHGDGMFSDERARDGDDSAMYEVPGAHTGKKSKHLGYQYGRVPWGDADITCLVDENGTPKFCLQELCSKVLRNQVKADVFDMVKNLNLPVLQGDTALLKKLQALGLHSNRSPICRLIAAEELWTLLDALQEPVPEEVHQHLENISSSTTPLLQSPSHTAGVSAAASSAGPVLHSPGLVAGGPSLIEEDEHGFQSTLHEMECSDGQYISILRTWNGEQYACLTEVWRKYFPEVNRNHLTSALKRLGLDTHMPTGQQATLLRSAGVISLRGAAGRLMRLEDTQMLLDDFGIPLQISPSSDSKEKPIATHAPPLAPPRPTMKLNSGTSVPPHISRRKMSAPGNFTNHMVSTAVKTEPSQDMLHAECMRNVLAAISYDDLVALLEKSRDEALSSTGGVDEDANAVASELDGVQQLIHSRRELCNILSSEIGYLTASNHAYMAEVVRLNHSGKQTLQDLESSLLAFNIILQ